MIDYCVIDSSDLSNTGRSDQFTFLYQTCVEGREPTAEFEIENK